MPPKNKNILRVFLNEYVIETINNTRKIADARFTLEVSIKIISRHKPKMNTSITFTFFDILNIDITKGNNRMLPYTIGLLNSPFI
jgi:hypothetical protein